MTSLTKTDSLNSDSQLTCAIPQPPLESRSLFNCCCNPHGVNALGSRWYQPLRRSILGLVLIPVRYFILGLFSLFFFSIFTLRPLFPHSLSSFSGTFVLPFLRNVLLFSGYVLAIGFIVALGVHSSRTASSPLPERRFTHGDPAQSDGKESPD